MNGTGVGIRYVFRIAGGAFCWSARPLSCFVPRETAPDQVPAKVGGATSSLVGRLIPPAGGDGAAELCMKAVFDVERLRVDWSR